MERYLGRAGGYVSTPAVAMDRLEAVSEEDQEAMTDASRRKALDARIARRDATSVDIERELAHIEGRARYLRRELKRLLR